MPRYVAFLRAVSPMNAKMLELARCFEAAGFTEVKTVLSSGNVAFASRPRTDVALAREIEGVMAKRLGRTFYTIVRRSSVLRELVASDPYAEFPLSADAKRVVTFLGEAYRGKISLPIEFDEARILATNGREVFSAYVPNPRGPAFMKLIERTLGTKVTTRTWDTVRKCAAA